VPKMEDSVEGSQPSKRPRRDGSHTRTADQQTYDPRHEQNEWLPIQVVGERSTEGRTEFETIVQRTMWLPKNDLQAKLLREFRAEQRRVGPTRRSSRLIGQSEVQ